MNWPTQKLDDVADFCLGKMLDKRKNKGDLRPYLANVNVRWGKFEFENLREMRFQEHELEKYGLRHGDIVMCEGGEPGRCAIWKNQMPGMMIQKALHRIRPHDCLHHKFLYYTFLFYGQTDQFSPLFTGATIKHLPREKLAQVEVPIPPLPTQRKIASILSAYDDLIENNTRRIAIAEEMAQAIYREWFVNFRFPGHENVKLVDSPLGQIPEGWEVVELQQLVSFANGKSIKPGGEGEYLVFGSNGVIGHSNEFRYACGIIIGRVGAYCGSIEYSPEPFWASDNTIVALSQHDDSFIPFVLFMLKDMNLNRHAGGAAQPLLTQTTLKRLKIVAPPNAAVDTFCEVANSLLRQKSCLEKKNHNLRNTRDLLLPKLISGKLDVEDLDIDVGLITNELQYEEPPELTDEDHEILDGIWDEIAEEEEDAKTNQRPIPIEEIETDRVMSEFRQESRKLGSTTRDDLIKAVSCELGYKRLGSNIEDVLKGHLRAAIRRKIVGVNGDEVWPETPTMDAYNRDELIDTFKSVMRKNQEYERDDVIRALANYLGFRRLTESVREPIKSAINGAIRRDVLSYQGDTIWREE